MNVLSCCLKPHAVFKTSDNSNSVGDELVITSFNPYQSRLIHPLCHRYTPSKFKCQSDYILRGICNSDDWPVPLTANPSPDSIV